MNEVIFGTGVFILLLVVGSIAFFIWVVWKVFAGSLKLLFGQKPVGTNLPNARLCPREKCLAQNPVHANYCHRCGVRLQSIPQHRNVTRAAMW